ncbi:MAG: tetratricopeptide repeat protein [Candidatus Methylomirabilales bacterium]
MRHALALGTLAATVGLSGPEAGRTQSFPAPEGADDLIKLFREKRQGRAAELERHLAKDPEDLQARIELAQTYALSGHLDQAITTYREVLTRDPTNITARFNLALVYHRAGRLAEAATEFREVIRRDPTDLAARIDLGVLLRDQQGALAQEAVEVLEAARRLRPDYADTYYHLGLAYKGLGDRTLACRTLYEQAVQAFDRYLALQPDGKRAPEATAWKLRLSDRLRGEC